MRDHGLDRRHSSLVPLPLQLMPNTHPQHSGALREGRVYAATDVKLAILSKQDMDRLEQQHVSFTNVEAVVAEALLQKDCWSTNACNWLLHFHALLCCWAVGMLSTPACGTSSLILHVGSTAGPWHQPTD